ncbi:MAG TPA: nitroreductase family protein [Albitalea sp.]|nr:nitroreductase family protein [Albitalea sp.]
MPTVPLDQATDMVALAAVRLGPGASLEEALQQRRSTRSFLADALPLEMLSSLLWCAFGVNRPDTGGRTAPSAHNGQEIDIYVVLPEGSFRYDARAHRLMLVTADDLRGLTGSQDFVAGAPLNLVYVADFSRMAQAAASDREFLAGVASGCIAQNVYLACAAHGLGTVVRGLVDRRRLAPALRLRATQRVTLAQTVGFPGP